MNEYKVRCSGISEIMPEPKDKKQNISVGAKTVIEKWFVDTKFGRKEEIKSKYLDKGNAVEDQGLNLIVSHLKLGMIYNNTEPRKTDAFKTGQIDFKYNDIVYDHKGSWSLKTFPMFAKKLDPKYYAQMQGYLDLERLKHGRVCYTLLDLPHEQLEKELKWIESHDDRQQKALQLVFTESHWNEAKERFFPTAKKVNFISIENKYRVKVFDVKYDPEFINKVHQKVLGCREYVKELEGMLNDPQR